MSAPFRVAAAPAPARATRQAAAPRAAAVDAAAPRVVDVPTPFRPVQDEATFFATMKGLVDAGKFPAKLVPLWEDFYNNYKTAVVGSGLEGRDEAFVARVQASIADVVVGQFVAPYEFPSYHERILAPYDYYQFGQTYVGGLIDFASSFVGGVDAFRAMEAQLARGENVVVLANHQTEADPAVWAHMLEKLCPTLATDVIYVAGDRVVSDPMCKPFSMGRNLLCVHSKKHMNDDPETAPAKQKQNRRTLVTMGKMLNEGGKLIWIAPAGGRDRPVVGAGPDGTDVWTPAAFDPASVGLMTKLASSSKAPTHLYPLAMVSWAVMPPPPALESALGERRLTNFSGVGVSACPELDLAALAAASPGAGADADAFVKHVSDHVFEEVTREYKELEAAIEDYDGARAKNASTGKFVQPWAA